MSNYLENQSPHYEEIKLSAAAAITGGPLALATSAYAFPLLGTIALGEDYIGVVKSPKVVAAKATGAIAVGQALYYDASENNVTTTSTDNLLIGFANEAALSADTTVNMRFDGTLPFVASLIAAAAEA